MNKSKVNYGEDLVSVFRNILKYKFLNSNSYIAQVISYHFEPV